MNSLAAGVFIGSTVDSPVGKLIDASSVLATDFR
jgi:hypothetical protein